MAASFKFNRKLPIFFRKYFLETNIKNNREISTCTVCLAKAKRKHKNKIDEPASQTNEGGSHNIIIPRKIERSPTAILEALASTVRYDANQPMYLSLDDPHLLPINDRMKKSHMAAKDSGRKAAQTMLAMYPDYFTQIWQDALPEAYTYDPYQGYQNKEPSEAALIERIKSKRVKDAIDIYQTCKRNGTSLSQESQEHLLELLTVYNCKEPDKTSDLGNFITVNYSLYFPLERNTWMRGNPAEEVFQSLPEKTATAYNLLLRGIADNYDEHAAMDFYNQMKEAKISVDLYTYNKLISLASINNDNVEDAIYIIKSIFQDMHDSGVHPDVDTFDAALKCLRKFFKGAEVRRFALSLVAEMEACGIEPQLSTFSWIINLFYYPKDRSNKDPALWESMLKYMEGKEYKRNSSDDVSFFRTALKALVAHFPDSSYALKLHNILKSGNNYKALGHRQFVFGYYSELLSIITPLEHTDVVMDIYQSIVPHVFLPSIDIYSQILENIKLNETHHYIPQLYTDLSWTGLLNQWKMLDIFVKSMASKKHAPELQEKFADISSLVIENYQMDREAGRKSFDMIGLGGSAIGNLILIFLNNEDPEKAMNAYKLYRDDKSLHSRQPSAESIARLTEHCISVKDYQNVQDFLSVMLTMDSSKVPGLVDLVLTSAKATELSEQEKNFYLGCAQEASAHIKNN